MKTEFIRIDQFGEIITGKTPPTEQIENFGDDYYFITPSDIKTYNEKYIGKTERGLSKIGASKLNGYMIKKDSVCFVCIGSTIGKMCMTERDSFTNQQINSIVVNKKYDPNYIFYLLRYFKGYFQSIGGGSGSGKSILNKSMFSKIKLETITDINKQKNIARVLVNYDNLINLNNKRIDNIINQIQMLYKEWFVKFRYPNATNIELYECNPKGWTTCINKSMRLPVGWRFGELREIGLFVRGKNITAENMVDGDIPVISAGLEPSGYHNVANVFGNSLTISASGANAGFLKYNLDDIWAADCSYYQNNENIWFVYNSLKYIENVITNLQCGAAQPHVYPKNINRLNIIIPEKRLINKFNYYVEPYYNNIREIEKENRKLIIQRDMLLPRLISDKI